MNGRIKIKGGAYGEEKRTINLEAINAEKHYHSAVEGTVFTHVHAVIYNAIFRKFMRRNNGQTFISVFVHFSIIIYTDSGLF